MEVIFLKETRVNKKTYSKGETLRVSDTIYKKLVANVEAKELKPKAKAKTEHKG